MHYPPAPAARSRIGAHADFSSVTLLFQDAVGGLEVERPARAGAFMVRACAGV